MKERAHGRHAYTAEERKLARRQKRTELLRGWKSRIVTGVSATAALGLAVAPAAAAETGSSTTASTGRNESGYHLRLTDMPQTATAGEAEIPGFVRHTVAAGETFTGITNEQLRTSGLTTSQRMESIMPDTVLASTASKTHPDRLRPGKIVFVPDAATARELVQARDGIGDKRVVDAVAALDAATAADYHHAGRQASELLAALNAAHADAEKTAPEGDHHDEQSPAVPTPEPTPAPSAAGESPAPIYEAQHPDSPLISKYTLGAVGGSVIVTAGLLGGMLVRYRRKDKAEADRQANQRSASDTVRENEIPGIVERLRAHPQTDRRVSSLRGRGKTDVQSEFASTNAWTMQSVIDRLGIMTPDMQHVVDERKRDRQEPQVLWRANEIGMQVQVKEADVLVLRHRKEGFLGRRRGYVLSTERRQVA